MNKNCFRLVFSRRLNSLVVVGENVLSAGKAASGARSGSGAKTGAAAVVATMTGGVAYSVGAVVVALAGSVYSGDAYAQAKPVAANTLPTGSQITSGSVASSVNGATMTINQASNKAIVNWNTFDVGSAAKVNINQPGSNAVILNRVVGNDPTQIHGQINANGQVMVVNPNGVVVGKDGSVSASGFTASSYGISDADFMAGRHKFERNGTSAGVRIDGKIEANSGGYVVLIGAEVTNNGKISAQQGTVVMAAGESVMVPAEVAQGANAPDRSTQTIGVPLSNRVRMNISASKINAAVTNTAEGVIVADGGQVLLQASALSDAVASVTHSGRIDVSGEKAGSVTLQTDQGRIRVDGVIQANSSVSKNAGGTIIIGRDDQSGKLSAITDVSGAKLEARAGFIETSGDHLKSAGVNVAAHTWLLDPVNIEINSSGVAATAGNSVVKTDDIKNALETVSNVVISTGTTSGSLSTVTGFTHTSGSTQNSGDIIINESITKTTGAASTLTLIANRNILVAAGKTISASSTGNKLNVIMNANSSGTGGGILFNAGSGITTNGGDITLGGGTSLNGLGAAVGDGVKTNVGIALISPVMNAGGGNIKLTGTTPVIPFGGSNPPGVAGIHISGSGTIATSGSGQIVLNGTNNTAIGSSTVGVAVTSGISISGGSTGDAISIVGDSRLTTTTGSWLSGVSMAGNVMSTGGNIKIIGYGGGKSTTANVGDYGVTITSGSISSVGSGTVTIVGKGGLGGSGYHPGVSISGSAAISSELGNISISGEGGVGGGYFRNHGVELASTKPINSISGNISIVGTAGSSDSYTTGVSISSGGVSTTLGKIDIEGIVKTPTQTAVSIAAPVSAGSDIYIHSVGGVITNSITGVIDGKSHVSIDNSGGSINTSTGAISAGVANSGSSSGVLIAGSVNATKNLNIFGASASESGVRINGTAVTVSGLNIYLDGKSNAGNGVTLSGATLSGAYINATGVTETGRNGFAWQGGNINATGTGGAYKDSTVTGESNASTTASNGYGAFMMYANGSVSAVPDTTLTLIGKATASVAGQNTKERGILIQGGRNLTTSGNITLKGTSNSSEGIAIDGTVEEKGSNSQLTLIGSTSATSSNNLNGVSIAGSVSGKDAAGSITIIGTATNAGTVNPDVGVTISGTIDGGNASMIDIKGDVTGPLKTGVNITNSAVIVSAIGSINVETDGSIVNHAKTFKADLGSVKLSADGKITENASITSSNGTQLWGKTGVDLNANITNTGTGAIVVHAGDNTTTTTATLTANASALITQNGNGGVYLVTDGTGHLTTASIINNGTGNVELSAGQKLSAGNGGGGQVKALAGRTVLNSNGGSLLIYSGSIANTGDVTTLDSVNLAGAYTATNYNSQQVAFNRAYGLPIAGGSNSQVIFRSGNPALIPLPVPQPAPGPSPTPSPSPFISPGPTPSPIISPSPVVEPTTSPTVTTTSVATAALPSRPTVLTSTAAQGSVKLPVAGAVGRQFNLASADGQCDDSADEEERLRRIKNNETDDRPFVCNSINNDSVAIGE